MSAEDQATLQVQVIPLAEGAVEIKAHGALDEASVDQLRGRLLDDVEGMRGRILLNLSRVERIDAAGIALLLLARIEIEASGGSFVVHSRESAVREALRGAGIGRFVSIAEDRVAAMAALAAST